MTPLPGLACESASHLWTCELCNNDNCGGVKIIGDDVPHGSVVAVMCCKTAQDTGYGVCVCVCVLELITH